MLTVSFCVPVYNRADRVRRCIESLIAQTAKKDEYEIIVIDDCSTDGTAQVVQSIFDEHGFTNGRIHTLASNSGSASAPRNAAAAMAHGEYLFFVDSDDYVAPGLVEKIRSCASEFGSDIIYPRYTRVTESGETTSGPHAFARNGDIGRADVVRNKMLYAMSVLKAFKRSEWERLNIQFDTALRTGEDILVVAKFLFNTATSSVIADQAYYIIVDHEADRLTQNPTSRRATFHNYGDILDIIYAGSLGDLEYKHSAAAMFISRIMLVGAGAGNAYLAPSIGVNSQNEWRKLYSELLALHLPIEADAYLAPTFKEKIGFLRSGDLVGARFAVAFHESREPTEKLDQRHLVDLAKLRADEALRLVKGSRTASAAASKRERQLATELQAVHSSLSWRVTAPLRASARLAKRFARALRVTPRSLRKHSIAVLRLDEDGRPEVVLHGTSAAKDFAVFAMMSPPGHRDARHRLPLRAAGSRAVAARLPIPPSVGASFASLSVMSNGELRPLGPARRLHRIESPEVCVTTNARGVRIERTAPAAPWRPVDKKEDQR